MQETRFKDSTNGKTNAYSKAGYGLAICHHGEILQGKFYDRDGTLRRGLVTLPCDRYQAGAHFVPDGSGMLTVEPAFKKKALRAVRVTLDHLKELKVGGRLIVDSDIPEGWGLGSSTGDVVAAIMAVADALEIELTEEHVGALAVESETAADSIMFIDRAVLFAQRDGLVIEDFGGQFPSFEVLGFNTEPNSNGVDTLAFEPANYNMHEIDRFVKLRDIMRQAVQLQDAKLLGQVATESSEINQFYLPKLRFDDMQKLAQEIDSVGLQMAHSGTVGGFIFDPGTALLDEKMAEASAKLIEWGFEITCRFQVGESKK
ncbi:hypothetical protein CIG75_06600 [Tumebacillus algifaecis]|uniref:GHMP kinase N-terminal domain-containing protein n=1 Tax=Tumebacillus algifaecis TaxID=1214604 RepID=A0A223CZB2_9BACL|nr:hypothetical protein [Tumebacillus algifaecis]ASS74672.1 hypothetical protein CIG75_06600 [Tumebacillus algifaecis]